MPFSPGRTEISVKCRIGVDSKDSYSDLKNFVTTVHDISGCTEFYVHARKAVLDGTFSPLDNRTIPPLKYDFVYQLKRERPDLKIHINGGVNSIKEIVQVRERELSERNELCLWQDWPDALFFCRYACCPSRERLVILSYPPSAGGEWPDVHVLCSSSVCHPACYLLPAPPSPNTRFARAGR